MNYKILAASIALRAIWVFFVVLGVRTVQDEYTLLNQELYTITSGNVTQAKREKNSEYYIQYSFWVDGKKFSAADQTGRKNLRINITKANFDALRDDWGINVRYEINNPWNNIPESIASQGWMRLADSYAIIIVGGLLFLCWFLIWHPGFRQSLQEHIDKYC